jgi:hypothetical protein
MYRHLLHFRRFSSLQVRFSEVQATKNAAWNASNITEVIIDRSFQMIGADWIPYLDKTRKTTSSVYFFIYLDHCRELRAERGTPQEILTCPSKTICLRTGAHSTNGKLSKSISTPQLNCGICVYLLSSSNFLVICSVCTQNISLSYLQYLARLNHIPAHKTDFRPAS